MSEQPKALALADALQHVCAPVEHWELCLKAAAELRLLHALNAQMLEALRAVQHLRNLGGMMAGTRDVVMAIVESADAAIDAAKDQA